MFIGKIIGLMYYYVDWKHRKLTYNNLDIAFLDRNFLEKKIIAKKCFQKIGSNLFAGIKLSGLEQHKVEKLIKIKNREIPEKIIDKNLKNHNKKIISEDDDNIKKNHRIKRSGYIIVLTHSSCWELLAQTKKIRFGDDFGTLYQALNNKYINNHIKKIRSSRSVKLFDRKNGFFQPTNFLKSGGVLGIFADQHAGDGGIWCPFFNRLASTTNLPALMAKRAKVPIVPLSVVSIDGKKNKWEIEFHKPIEEKAKSIEEITYEINLTMEKNIKKSPSDWFWVHNRWKTPKPNFLLKKYKRGTYLPNKFIKNNKKLCKFNILIRSPNWLGDACMATQAIKAIKNGRQDCNLVVLCPEKLFDYWDQVSEIDGIITKKNKESIFSVSKKIRKYLNSEVQGNKERYFEVGIVFPNSHRSVLELKLGKCHRIVGNPRKFRNFLIDQLIIDKKKSNKNINLEDKSKHHSEEYNRIAKYIGCDIDFFNKKSVKINLNKKDLQINENNKKVNYNNLKIGICAGAEFGSAKRWGVKNFSDTINDVSSKVNEISWIFFGTKKDLPIYDEICKNLNVNNVKYQNLCGETTLKDLIQHLKECDLLITNDTGTMHLAASLGVRTISIFGSTDPNWTHALEMKDGSDTIVYKKVDCSPCFQRTCPFPIDSLNYLKCMKQITPNEITSLTLEAVTKIHDSNNE